MNLFNKIYEQALNLLLAVILSFCLDLAVLGSLQYHLKLNLIFSFVILSMLLFSFVFKNKKASLISLYIFILLIILTIIYLNIKGLFSTFIYNLRIFIYWIIDFIQGYGPYDNFYAILLAILISFGITLFIYFFAVKYFNFYVILIAGCALFVAQWMNNFFTSYMALYIFLFIIVIYYFRFIYLKNNKRTPNNFVSLTAFTLWLLPLSALILIISFSLHPKMVPMQWKWFDHNFNIVYNFFNKSFISYKTPDFFTIADSGFGENNVLGGKVKLNKTVVLTVDSPAVVYLKGISRDFYSGTNWGISNKASLSITNKKNTLNKNSMELISNLAINNYEPNKYYSNDKLKITFQNLKSKSLFLTANTNSIKIPTNKSIRLNVNSDGTIKSNKVISKGFTYSLNIYRPFYDDENFIGLLKSSGSSRYNERNYSEYLQLPSSLPERVKGLSETVIHNRPTDYDKVKAIEEYLATKFLYTLIPKSTPKNRDFVDYFLFDLKEGYCTYFATAMTVMVRSVGIPARYVEGYVLPAKPKKGTTYEVTNEQAHAWVEVYFENVGWIPFEPTSAFRVALYDNEKLHPYSKLQPLQSRILQLFGND